MNTKLSGEYECNCEQCRGVAEPEDPPCRHCQCHKNECCWCGEEFDDELEAAAKEGSL